jgi:DNA uptake protein ComE-like DNA-binding protein
MRLAPCLHRAEEKGTIMHNVDRNRQGVADETRQHHSGPTDEGQGAAGADSSADTQSIDLNHAPWQQLAGVDGLDEACARAIVEHRTFHGHFRTWDELAAVQGMNPERIQALQHAARIGGVES